MGFDHLGALTIFAFIKSLGYEYTVPFSQRVHMWCLKRKILKTFEPSKKGGDQWMGETAPPGGLSRGGGDQGGREVGGGADQGVSTRHAEWKWAPP